MSLNELVSHWGYLAIFAVVVLGNVGLPVPEETILALGGYLCSQGKLRIPLVLAVGVVSAIVGDNLGYWVGRRYGPGAFARYGALLLGGPERMERARSFVGRRGATGVFLARFIPGMRFAAGPLAGALGMPFAKFVVANALGVAAYVPVAIGAGYALGYGLGGYVEPLRHVLGEVEHVVLAIAAVATAVLLVRRLAQGFRARPPH
jgi:membrane protein DedA with SNARE-associated domain